MPDKTMVTDLLDASGALRCEVQDLATKVDALVHSNETLVESNKQLTQSDSHQRRGILALTAGGALLLLVVIGMIYALLRIDEANDRLDDQVVADVQSCERGNDTRAAQRQQWLDARNLLTALGAGPETRKLADGLVSNANRNFPHLDCAAIRDGKKPPVVPPATPKPPR